MRHCIGGLICYRAQQDVVNGLVGKGVIELPNPEQVRRHGAPFLVQESPSQSLQCVAIVKYAVPELHVATKWHWCKGMSVWVAGPSGLELNPDLPDLCAIACGWENGRYKSKPTGNHAAIFVKARSSAQRIFVYDQFKRKKVAMRDKKPGWASRTEGDSKDYAVIMLLHDDIHASG